MDRRKTKLVNIGGVLVGGGESVKIQSMTTTKTADVESTVSQILALEIIMKYLKIMKELL